MLDSGRVRLTGSFRVIPSSSSSAPDGLRYYGGMAKEKPKPGPEAERLKVEGHKGGWPKDEKPSREDHGEGK